MADNNYIIQLKAALDKAKSEKQINQDLKAIEKNIRQLNLVASLYKGDSKKQLDSVIAELESKVQVVKLRTKFDQKQTQKEVGEALNNVSFSDIKLDKQGIELAAQKAYNILDSVISKHTITPAIEWKKGKLQKELQDFLKQNSKIQESAAFKKQAEEVEGLFAAAGNADTLDYATEKFKLFKSEAKATGYASTSISSIFTGIFKNAVKLADKLDLVNFGIQKFKESIGTLKDMSTILNDISKASNITQKDLKQLADDSFQIAGKYGKSGTNYLESVREMARSGYGDNSKEMGELSLLSQSAGEMTADLANSYLLATDSAYKYNGQVEKLTAALDGANNVSDKNNISLTEIAEASRISASDASKAGVSIDQLTAAEAAMIAVTKGSGSEIGESFQSVLLHLQKVKGEFNGEIIDDAQIQKVENRCRELGVQLETIGQNGTMLRDPMAILKELAEVYRTLPDGSDQKQGLLADLGGKHVDSLSALLDNWDLYEKMLTDFSQGGGSALKEASQEADSWEGRIVSLQNSWDSLVNSLTNQDYVKGGISFLDNAIQGFEKLTETIGAIPVMLTALNTALLAKKPDYGITQIFNPDSGKVDIQGNLMGIDFTAIKNQKKHFKEASDAINKWKEQLDLGKTDINAFGEAIVENNSHLKAYLSTCSKEAPPSLIGYQSYLKSLGVSTDILKFKTILLTEALSFGIGLGLQVLVSGITKYIQDHEKMRQESIEAANAADEESKKLSDLLAQYNTLSNAVKNNQGSKEDLLSIQNQLLDSLGIEEGQIDSLIEKYGNLDTAINKITLDALKKAEGDLAINIGTTKDDLLKAGGKSKFINDDIYVDYSDSDIVKKIESLNVDNIKLNTGGNFGEYSYLETLGDTSTVEGIKSNYDSLMQLRDGLESLYAEEGKGKKEELFNSHFYKDLTNEIDKVGAAYEKYKSAVDAYNENQAEQQILTINTDQLPKTKEEFESFKQEMIESAVASGEFIGSQEDISNALGNVMAKFPSLKQYFNDLKSSEESDKNGFSPISKQDVISRVNSLSGGFESLNKIMNSISDKDNPFDYSLLDDSSFKDNFENLGTVYTDFIDKITSSPKDIEATQSAFDDLVTAWINGSSTLNGLTGENAELMAVMLQNMGVSNAEEVVTSRLAIAQEHLAAQKAYTADMSDALANASAKNIPSLLDEATQSDIAKVALAGLALEKANLNGTALDTNGDIDNIIALTEVIGTANTALKNYNTLKKGGSLGGPIDKKTYDKIKGDAQKELDNAVSTASQYKGKGSVQNIKYNNNVPTNSNASGSYSKSKPEKSAPEAFDWMSRQLKILEDKRSELLDKASSTYIDYLGITQDEFNRAQKLINSNVSLMPSELDELSGIAQEAGLSIGELYSLIANGNPEESKGNYLEQALELDKELLPEYANAVALYQSEYEKAASKISVQNKAKIELGDTSIDNLSGDEAANVRSAMTAYDKWKDMQDSQYKAQKKHLDTIVSKYDNVSASIESENAQLNSMNSLLKAQMDYYKSAGEIVGTSYYDSLSKNTESSISNKEKLIANKQAELKDLLANGVPQDSEEYQKLKKEIDDAEVNLYDLRKSQEEYNNELIQMPIKNLSTVISMYKDITTSIENWGSEMEASGKKLNSNYYHQLISNGLIISAQYEKQISLIEEAMGHYTEGSDTWNELYSQLQDVNSEMSSMVQNLQKWNEELLNMPLERISSYSSDLQKVADGLSNVKSEYDTVISAVTGALNDQIDAINKQKDAVNEEYEASKNALQDKLDLLNKQNNELKLQQKYEQSLYNLQKVNQQATEKVIRDGQIVYEQDSDKLREAQEAFQDAKFDLETSQIQTQIDDLQETLDGLNEKYQDQIDSLQKISDKWSEISDKITQVQNEAKASEVLGNNWKDKVLSGNDTDIFNNFSGMYTDISNQLIRYQEQIETTNNIYSLLEDYIASYKDGSLSYGEALTGINNLLSQMNKKMLAGDNLKNIYDYLGAVNGSGPDANDILASIQQGLTASAGELVKSLEQYNKNSGMISEYTSSWQQLTNNVSSMLDVLKEVRDNLENASDEDEDDDDRNDKTDGEPYMGGPRVESGPGVPLINSSVQVQSLKSGIENGLVGSSSTSNREAKMKLLGLKKLDSDELAAILHKKEAVFNPDQQDMLLTNLSKAWNYIPAEAPYYTDAAARAGQPVTKFEFGDINIQKCDNVDALAQGILNGGLRSAMIQQAGIR